VPHKETKGKKKSTQTWGKKPGDKYMGGNKFPKTSTIKKKDDLKGKKGEGGGDKQG